jgi:hypothetical protein
MDTSSRFPRVARVVAAGGHARPFDAWAATTGTDWETYTRQRPGMSAFALEKRSRLPRVLSLCARPGRPVGHLPVARPGAARAKRGARPRRPAQLVPPPRRVHPRKRGQQIARPGRPARRRTTTHITRHRAHQLHQKPHARATRNGGYPHPGLDQPRSLTVIPSRALRGPDRIGRPNGSQLCHHARAHRPSCSGRIHWPRTRHRIASACCPGRRAPGLGRLSSATVPGFGEDRAGRRIAKCR